MQEELDHIEGVRRRRVIGRVARNRDRAPVDLLAGDGHVRGPRREARLVFHPVREGNLVGGISGITAAWKARRGGVRQGRGRHRGLDGRREAVAVLVDQDLIRPVDPVQELLIFPERPDGVCEAAPNVREIPRGEGRPEAKVRSVPDDDDIPEPADGMHRPDRRRVHVREFRADRLFPVHAVGDVHGLLQVTLLLEVPAGVVGKSLVEEDLFFRHSHSPSDSGRTSFGRRSRLPLPPSPSRPRVPSRPVSR